MSMPYLEEGRIQQKRRTRDALIAAARDLVARGETPTVEVAAEASGISRTTAYRYFPNQTALLAAAHPETQTVSLIGDAPPRDLDARVAIVLDAFIAMVESSEPQQRSMLRLSLDERSSSELPLRQGRAIRWFEEALTPLEGKWSDAEITALAKALRAATGIEARVWLTDIGGLSSEEASEMLRWIGLGLLRGARATRPPA
ncbi:MAG: TetR/AcrR family transcriptional regulator [Acidimicrobiales bacterium]|nr:TetR/AcrR family transcriptional regulator [Acidimicrobiales bacterium]